MTGATALSNRLFSPPAGLFCRLGPTEAERRVISTGELFRSAQRRVHDLAYEESAALAEAVRVVQARLPGVEFRLRLEPISAH